jgi:hypothetical protein
MDESDVRHELGVGQGIPRMPPPPPLQGYFLSQSPVGVSVFELTSLTPVFRQPLYSSPPPLPPPPLAETHTRSRRWCVRLTSRSAVRLRLPFLSPN